MTEKAKPRVTHLAEAAFAPRFAYGDQAEVNVVSGPDQGTALGTGYGRLMNARIPWTIKYDEVMLVLEGSVTVHAGGAALTANAHDCIWLPAGTDLIYEAEHAVIFYAIHPANWADAENDAGSGEG